MTTKETVSGTTYELKKNRRNKPCIKESFDSTIVKYVF